MPDNAVVITGAGIVSSIGNDPQAFDRALRAMESGLAAYDSPFLKVMGQIRGFDFRAAPVWDGLPPDMKARAVQLCRRSSLSVQTTVIAALQAYAQAGLANADPERVSILTAGSNLSQGLVYETYAKAAGALEFVSPSYAIRHFDTYFNGLLSELMGIRGEGMTVGGASASGNVCLIQGMRLIRAGAADACVCAAPLYDFSPVELSAYCNLQAFGDYGQFARPEEACRPFDAGHKGFVPGQASVCLVLESAAHARGKKALAELAGGAVALDGNHLPNASAEGECRAMRRAMEDAGITLSSLDYINAHATSTPGGDRTEAEAIALLTGDEGKRIWVNATKSLTGHCLYSAGMVEALATICQLRGSYVHGTRNLTAPITDALRFAYQTEEGQQIRCALSNSFGFGGINASVVIRRADK